MLGVILKFETPYPLVNFHMDLERPFGGQKPFQQVNDQHVCAHENSKEFMTDILMQILS